MTTTFFTGPSAPDVALAATAAAQHFATTGQRTLLFSSGPAHYLPVEAAPGLEPHHHAPSLDVLAFDAVAALGALWERGRAELPGQLRGISGEELPLMPGIEPLLAFQRLGELAAQYENVVVAAGTHDMLLRALAMIDGLRWGVRLLFGLDRGEGASAESVGRALLPTALLPFGLVDGAQGLRVEAERARAALLDPARARACFVLPALPPALVEARHAIPALQLHGLRVDLILVGPDSRTPAESEQHVLSEVRRIWASRSVQPFATSEDTIAGVLPPHGASNPPITFAYAGEPAVVIDLPGLAPGAVRLTLSADELIVRIGSYRRHMLLPPGLRGITNIKATREGETLVLRKR